MDWIVFRADIESAVFGLGYKIVTKKLVLPTFCHGGYPMEKIVTALFPEHPLSTLF